MKVLLAFYSLGFVLVALLGFGLCCVLLHEVLLPMLRLRFLRRRPVISEQEWTRTYFPGLREDVLVDIRAIRKIISNILRVDISQLRPEDQIWMDYCSSTRWFPFDSDSTWDSITADLASFVHEERGRELEYSEMKLANNWRTLSDVITDILELLQTEDRVNATSLSIDKPS